MTRHDSTLALKLLIIGNSQQFNHVLHSLLTNSSTSPPSSSSLRLFATLVNYEVRVANSEIDTAHTWPLEALQVDGIILAIITEE